jgi:hypothetical protein
MARPGSATPIDRSLVDRVAGAVRGALTGWMGPGEPPPPAAPPEVRGRRFDFPVAVNTVYQPRGEQGENAIDFASLRALSDPALGGLDVLRIAIERRKDQMCGQHWALKGRDGSDGGKRARDLELVMRRPDGVNTYRNWQRMLLEDLFVIDAPTLYLRRSRSGQLYALDPVDGSTIKRLIDIDGRTPTPPDPAYQQVLHGVPAVDYTTQELIYRPRNARTHKLYGFSPVERKRQPVPALKD